ncbi:MAG: ribonuclease III [Candidatus Liptonbacteria bacterium]
MRTMPEFNDLEHLIGIVFKRKELLEEALTHRSYLNEHPEWGLPHNERLEYLGDAVLELAVSEDLFQQFAEYPEGQLTVLRASLVNYQRLGKVAADLQLDKYILMSKGERADISKAREVILANTIEALIGAIYLDQGFAVAKNFIMKFVMVHLPEILEAKSYKDPKSQLQEMVQERMKVTPTYQVIDESGPAHRRIFRVGVYYDNAFIAEGEGMSKQEAEVEAAKQALETFYRK